MCGIAGFCNLRKDYVLQRRQWIPVLRRMNIVQKHRGPDDDGIYLKRNCGMAHVRLSIIDLRTGHQPMVRRHGTRECCIIFNGEIYNMRQLKSELMQEGEKFETTSDTEVILVGFMRYGPDFIKRLNGIFAIAIWDETSKCMFLFRDRLGVKPLFYTQREGGLIFASEMKALFEYPGVRPTVDKEGLCEIFALGPAKSYGKGVFHGIEEVLPGHYLCFEQGMRKDQTYWKLESRVHEDSFWKTVEKTSFLVEDAIKMQMLADIPISTFLSGGVDSSLVTAVCAKERKKHGEPLNTFSFDFEENSKYFQANSFQPSQDRPWVDQMVQYCGSDHRYLVCNNDDMIENLFRAVDARDLPCMADVESSLLYFCSKVVAHNKVTLTGECADEIFGGYPWFHKKEAFETHAFPWSTDLAPRKMLLLDDLIQELPLEEYAKGAYEKTICETPILSEDTLEEKRRREIAYLNLKWFMVTLLDRMDRTSMYSGLEARVPLADHRIVEYVWNVPWKMKCPNGIVKGLLRLAGVEHLPQEILWRRKSPYPKSYHPEYEKLLGRRLKDVLSNPNAPIRQFLDLKKVNTFLDSPSDYGCPWYGQLMAGPQMLAFMLQVNYWMEKYRIQIL